MVAYGTDIDKAIEVVDEVGQAMAEDPVWKRRVLEPPRVERVEALGEYGVTLKILGSVRAADQWAAGGEFRKRLLAAFKEHGIEIPRPQRVVLARDPDGAGSAPAGSGRRTTRRAGRRFGVDVGDPGSPIGAGPRVEWPGQPIAGGGLRERRAVGPRSKRSLRSGGPSRPTRPSRRRRTPSADLYEEAERDFEAFWAKIARERINWSKPFETTLEWDLPFAKWFVGGELNITYNCVDRHVERGLGDKVAYHWIGEPGDTRTHHLRRPPPRGPEGRQRAQGARHQDGRPGRDLHADDPGAADRDARLRPARARRTRSSSAASRAEALAGRINDAEAKLVITADGGWRRGKPADAQAGRRRRARGDAHDRARPRRPAPRRRGAERDHGGRVATSGGTTSSTARRRTARRSRSTASTCSTCSTRPARRPSPRGSSTRPPAISLGTSYSHEMIFDVKPDDVYWCAADVGWVTGHSYIVYGPLANATTGVMYEGTPGHARVGPLVADHRGLQGHDPVLRPDGDPGLHEAGRGAPGEARPVVAARAGLRR